MFKKIVSLLLVTVMILGLAVGCGNKNTTDSELKIGALEYEVVNSNTIENEEIMDWIEQNSTKEGLFVSEAVDEYRYVLVGAGEQNTGGYSVEVTSVTGTEDKIEVNAKLNVPNEGDMVTEALTYPYTVIKVADDNREVSLGEFVKSDNKDPEKEIKNEVGTYVGQIDSNSVEITIGTKTNAYRLSEEAKGYFDVTSSSYKGINENDTVEFFYYEDETTGQLVITDINSLNKEGSIKGITLGEFVGKIDNNSIEIKVNGESSSYTISDRVKELLDNGLISEGNTVSFTSTENEQGQIIITDIRKEPGYYLNK